MSRFVRALLTLGLPLLLSGSATAGYSFSQIDGPNPNTTFALGINNSNQIVGYYVADEDQRHHAFQISAGGDAALDVFGADSEAWGINQDGAVVGSYVDGSRTYGFRLVSGKVTTIEVPGAIGTYARGINRAGQIVGISQSGTARGFLLSDDQFTTIQDPSASSTFANAINDLGQIVGSSRPRSFSDPETGFLMNSAGQFVDVIYVPRADFTRAFGINNDGDIVGTYYLNGQFHGFLRSGGVIVTIDVPDAAHTYAMGINDDGAIVGYFYPDPFTTVQHGFLAIPR